MVLSRRIKILREEILRMTKKQLAEKLVLSVSAITRWEKGDAIPSQKNLISLCKLADISMDRLLSGESFNIEVKTEKIRFYKNSIGNYFDSTEPEFITIANTFLPVKNMDFKNLIAFCISSDSMEPTITSQAMLLVDSTNIEIEEGKIYAFQQNGITRVKKFIYEVNSYVIKSINKNYSDEKIEFKEFKEHTKVIGRVVCCINKL